MRERILVLRAISVGGPRQARPGSRKCGWGPWTLSRGATRAVEKSGLRGSSGCVLLSLTNRLEAG